MTDVDKVKDIFCQGDQNVFFLNVFWIVLFGEEHAGISEELAIFSDIFFIEILRNARISCLRKLRMIVTITGDRMSTPERDSDDHK